LVLRGVKTIPSEGERAMEEKKKKKGRFHITIEELEDEGEEQLTEQQPTTRTLESRTRLPVQQAKCSKDWHEWRQRKVALHQRE
jgi:hypothetical protein